VWPHQHVEFYGDRLEIRVPTPRAMSALQMGLSKHNPPAMRNEFANRFLRLHLSDASYERFFDRMFNPDETDYTNGTLMELIDAMLSAGNTPAETPAAPAAPA
jgi:hypothetical protein